MNKPIYNSNYTGKWSEMTVLQQFENLHSKNHSHFELNAEPVHNKHFIHIPSIMPQVATGLLVNNYACIELSIEFIKDNIMESGSGYLRALMARRLKSCPLEERQASNLRRIFFTQLKNGKMHQEYKEYIKLFKKIELGEYHHEIYLLTKSTISYIARAANKLLVL